MFNELIQETQKLLTFESYPGKEKEVSDYIIILMKRLGFRDVFRDEYGSIFGFIGPRKETTEILFDQHLLIRSIYLTIYHSVYLLLYLLYQFLYNQ